MRKQLEELYKNIKIYEDKIKKATEEIINTKNEIEKLSSSLNSDENLTKIEKLKKQVDISYLESKLEMAEMEKEYNLNSEVMNLQNTIVSELKNIEDSIYIAVRINDFKYFKSLEKLKEKHGEENYKASLIKNFVISNCNKKTEDFLKIQILPELSSIYEYYKKISDMENQIIDFLNKEAHKKLADNIISEKILIHQKKLDVIEQLIDEMAAEIIMKDMEKNDIVVPEFVKEMRYFKKIRELQN